MWKLLWPITLGFVLFGSWLGCEHSRPLDSESEVYRAFLESRHAESLQESILYEQAGIFFIYNLDQEHAGEISTFFKQRTQVDLDPQLVEDFVMRNRSPRSIDKGLLPGTLRYDREFMKKNVYSLSRVGFNTELDEGLLYASYSSIAEFGHGSLVHLKKRFGVWKVQDIVAVWVYG